MSGARLVSAVIPVWNRRALIAGAIESVLDQTLPPGWELELIVVDDGSDDGTVEQIRRFGNRVRLLSRPHCGFPGAVRNRGVDVAEGEVVAFLDSDDRWLPGKLLRQLPLHEDSDVRLSHTRERWERNGRRVSQASQRHRRSGDIYTDALTKCIVGPSTVIVDRDLYRATGGFREDLEVAEDYEYWLRILVAEPAAYVDEPLTVKQAGPWPQLSETYGQIEGFRIDALRGLVRSGVLRERGGDGRDAQARTELARKLRVYARGARKRGRATEAAACEAEAAAL